MFAENVQLFLRECGTRCYGADCRRIMSYFKPPEGVRPSTSYLEPKLFDADETVAKQLSSTNEQAGLSEVLVDGLLDYTRGRHVEKVTGEINPWLQKLLEEFKDLTEEEVTCEFALDIPPLTFDRDKMRRVVLKLITNALQAVSGRNDILL